VFSFAGRDALLAQDILNEQYGLMTERLASRPSVSVFTSRNNEEGGGDGKHSSRAVQSEGRLIHAQRWYTKDTRLRVEDHKYISAWVLACFEGQSSEKLQYQDTEAKEMLGRVKRLQTVRQQVGDARWREKRAKHIPKIRGSKGKHSQGAVRMGNDALMQELRGNEQTTIVQYQCMIFKEVNSRSELQEGKVDFHGLVGRECVFLLYYVLYHIMVTRQVFFPAKVKSIRLITGKGLHSRGSGPVLANLVRKYLGDCNIFCHDLVAEEGQVVVPLRNLL
jgi:DNA-nicking Smr family endonuclease